MVTVGAEMVEPEGSSVQFMVGFKFIGVQPVVFRGGVYTSHLVLPRLGTAVVCP